MAPVVSYGLQTLSLPLRLYVFFGILPTISTVVICFIGLICVLLWQFLHKFKRSSNVSCPCLLCCCVIGLLHLCSIYSWCRKPSPCATNEEIIENEDISNQSQEEEVSSNDNHCLYKVFFRLFSCLCCLCFLVYNFKEYLGDKEYYRNLMNSIHEMMSLKLFQNVNTISGFKIPKGLKVWIVCVLFLLASYSASIFLEAFMLEEVYECDTMLSCFRINSTLSSKPITCTQLDLVICYKFIFEFSTATSESVTTFGIGVGMTILYVHVTLILSQGQHAKNRDVILTVTFQILIFVFVITFDAVITFNLYSKVITSTTKLVNKSFRFLNFIAINIVLLAFPWCKFKRSGNTN